jgi:hypothetical protein
LAASTDAQAKYLLPHLELSAPFRFVVGSALGLDRTAVAGKVTGIRKAFDLAHFHRNGHPENLAHSRQAQQLGVALDGSNNSLIEDGDSVV